MPETIEELSYELSLRALGDQEETLKDIRGRASTVLAASSLVASFIGGRAFDAVGFNWATVPGIAAFVLTIAPAVYVLDPTGSLRFSLDGTEVYEHFAARGSSVADAQRDLAYWIEDARRRNRTVVERAWWSLRVGLSALVLEVVMFLVALGVH
jgi:hypothetical protein